MRESLGPIVVAILCIVALGLAAATLTSVVNPDAESGVEGPQGGSQPVDDVEGSERSNGAIDLGNGCNAIKPMLPVLFLVSVTVAVGSYSSSRELTTAGMTFVKVFVPLVLIAFLVSAAGGCGPPGIHDYVQNSDSLAREDVGNIKGSNSTTQNETVGEGGSDDSSSPIVPKLPWPFMVLAAIVAVLFALVAFRTQRDESLIEPVRTSEEDVTESIGAVAGETAARLEADEALENAVYEAWAEMASILDVEDPETSTPAEFADAAREAGIEAGDVDELTGLFEEVRYGTVEATPLREQRAIDALRRIERTYTDTTSRDERQTPSGRDERQTFTGEKRE